MGRVFISYSKHDRRTAENLCSYLEDRNISCWIAPRDIASGNYAGEITRALRASDITIVLCSKHSSRSEHVKNEVTLAFNNAKQIIPYCLEENPFDDDLEYFLSSKQRITASGNQNADFTLIDRMIREYRNEMLIPETGKTVSHHRSWIPLGAGISFTVLLCIGFVFFRNAGSSKPAEDVLPSAPILADTTAPQEALHEKNARIPQLPTSVKLVKNNTFTGRIVSGRPDGFGTYTFRKDRRIDMHDPEGRMASAGDYIQGDWKDGHLNYGEWYGADGTLKAFLQLGDQPDTETDYPLGTCSRP